jgi:hypothetical protein
VISLGDNEAVRQILAWPFDKPLQSVAGLDEDGRRHNDLVRSTVRVERRHSDTTTRTYFLNAKVKTSA